nr:MAG TPA: hypothetical protein [Caudoviricetes sp.]
MNAQYRINKHNKKAYHRDRFCLFYCQLILNALMLS